MNKCSLLNNFENVLDKGYSLDPYIDKLDEAVTIKDEEYVGC